MKKKPFNKRFQLFKNIHILAIKFSNPYISFWFFVLEFNEIALLIKFAVCSILEVICQKILVSKIFIMGANKTFGKVFLTSQT